MPRRIFGFFALLMFAAFPLSAQEQEDDALEVVTRAFENLAALESYGMEMEQSITQDITVGEEDSKFTIHQTISQQANGAVNLETGDVSMSIDQEVVANTGLQTVNLAMTMDIVIIDSVLYLRFDNVSDAFASMYPTGWINVSEDPVSFPGAELLNTDTFIQIANSPVLYPINEETVAEVVEQEGEILDGVAMRVFDITLDVEAVFESGANSVAGMFDFSSLGLDFESMMAIMVQGLSIQSRVWIGEDSLVYQLDANIVLNTVLPGELMGGTAASLQQESTSHITLTDFNVPVEIEAPEVE